MTDAADQTADRPEDAALTTAKAAMSAEAGPSTLAKTAMGTAWTVAWRMVNRTLGLISTVALVRLLRPEDFGLVSLAVSFTQSVELFSFLGIDDALVREKAPTRATYDTAFTLGLIRGLALAAIIAAGAYPASLFFNEPRLTVIILALALGFAVEGLTNIGIADFRRHFDFHLEFRLWILPRAIGAFSGILAAYILRSYWALVIATLSHRIPRVIATYVMHPYRPRLSLKEWRNLTSYSFWNWISGMISMTMGQVDTFIIGRTMGATQVGFYGLGGEMATLPQTELVEPLMRTAFSAFSESRRKDESPAEIWLRIAGAASMLSVPATVGISLVAHDFVQVVFGTLWLSAVPLVQIFGIFALVGVFSSLSNCMFQAYGQLRTQVSVRAVLLVARIGLVLAVIHPFGLIGAALVGGVLGLIETSTVCLIAFHRIGISIRRQVLPVLWRGLLSTAVMAGSLWGLGLGWVPPPVGRDPYLGLFGVSALGAVIYTASVALLWVLSGRPDGPERDLLTAFQRLTRGLFRKAGFGHA